MKLTLAARDSKPGCKRSNAGSDVMIECESTTMLLLVGVLGFMAKDYLDGPIMDQTQLTGSYNLKLNFLKLFGSSVSNCNRGSSRFR
jgi:uncharacterized protein (TIGR03435 family)